jgi:hypothetical protein
MRYVFRSGKVIGSTWARKNNITKQFTILQIKFKNQSFPSYFLPLYPSAPRAWCRANDEMAALFLPEGF